MARLIYGKRAPFLRFANDSEFYEAYGFLCNPQKHKLEFQWEYNAGSGAWGNEGRIHFLFGNAPTAYAPIPRALAARLSAGRGTSIALRLNCNDFINELVLQYGFRVNPAKPGNIATRSAQGLIPPPDPKNFVPPQYLPDYNRGYMM